MPLLENLSHIFEYPWKNVSMASWKKYPCEDRPDVLSVDIVARDLDKETGVLRVVFMEDKLPRLIAPFFGSGIGIMVENSYVDPTNQVMILKSRNISFESVIQIEETCKYTVHPENPNWTMFDQRARVTAFPFGVSGMIESFMVDKFRTNAVKGRTIMENAIERVITESSSAYGRVMQEIDERGEALGKATENLFSVGTD